MKNYALPEQLSSLGYTVGDTIEFSAPKDFAGGTLTDPEVVVQLEEGVIGTLSIDEMIINRDDVSISAIIVRIEVGEIDNELESG